MTPTSTPFFADLQELTKFPCVCDFFDLAEKRLLSEGVTLSLTTLEEAAHTQARNTDSWALFPPMLDPRLSHISKDQSFGIVGRDASGTVVCAQGARFYDCGTRTFADIVADQSFCYGDAIPPPGEFPIAEVESPLANLVTGRFVYSGGLWHHTSLRGKGLSSILPRLARYRAFVQWDTEWTVGMVRDFVKPEHMLQYGYKQVAMRFTFRQLSKDGSALHWQLMIMNRAELEEDLQRFLAVQGT